MVNWFYKRASNLEDLNKILIYFNNITDCFIFQYQPHERAHWLLDAYNITVDNLLNRQYFKHMFWKSSNIDIQLLDNVSAKCFSIGYHFDVYHLLHNINSFIGIYPLLTVNTSCFHDNYEVSNF